MFVEQERGGFVCSDIVLRGTMEIARLLRLPTVRCNLDTPQENRNYNVCVKYFGCFDMEMKPSNT
jgi:hypothetical protein